MSRQSSRLIGRRAKRAGFDRGADRSERGRSEQVVFTDVGAVLLAADDALVVLAAQPPVEGGDSLGGGRGGKRGEKREGEERGEKREKGEKE